VPQAHLDVAELAGMTLRLQGDVAFVQEQPALRRCASPDRETPVRLLIDWVLLTRLRKLIVPAPPLVTSQAAPSNWIGGTSLSWWFVSAHGVCGIEPVAAEIGAESAKNTDDCRWRKVC
jgi:hypothetical protein